jgi:diacylglycerol kinase (ATP)
VSEKRWTGLARVRSFAYAFAGLRHLIKEPNAQIHAAATLAVIALGGIVRISNTDWRWLVVAIAGVWIAEALNTALERLADAVSMEPDPAIGAAKDLAAAAVLLAAIAATLIGALVFWPYLVGSVSTVMPT